ncbi:hypothetical protein ALC56_08939 [Trachymyrmex septentrionalis]|uniref:Uncharacterized protein n=1 Tax=Trachymyrmex septentrionalis TaxID=34720 RepID=A0A195F9N0_9HYME|nr:hypothetical protein ALC56_08939 [Trachymyrmex septentrionalis]
MGIVGSLKLRRILPRYLRPGRKVFETSKNNCKSFSYNEEEIEQANVTTAAHLRRSRRRDNRHCGSRHSAQIHEDEVDPAEMIGPICLSLRSTNDEEDDDDDDDDDDERSCAPEPLFPLRSPPSLYLGGRLCTHPFARRETGNGSTGINENSRRRSFEIPLENQRRLSSSPTVVSLIVYFASP